MDKHDVIFKIAQDIFDITKINFRLNLAKRGLTPDRGVILEEHAVILDLLQHVDRDLTMGEVASYSAISPSRLSKIMNVMEMEKKYVKRMFAPRDRRQIIVQITREGKQAIAGFRVDIIEKMSIIMHEIDEDRLPTVATAAKLFKNALEQVVQKKIISHKV